LNILEKLSKEKENLQKDLDELESIICPQYEQMYFNVQTDTNELELNYNVLTKAADRQGDILHKAINAIVNRRKSEIQTFICSEYKYR
jgi:hypothetical protein